MRALLLALALSSGLVAQTDPALLSQQGKQAMAERRFADAARIYAQLVELVPGNPGLLLNQGMALAMAGRDAQAIGSLEKAVEIEPKIFPAWLFLGGAHLRGGNPDKAVVALEKAHALQPDDLEVRALLGEAYAELGRHRAALPHWKAIAKANPEDPTAQALIVQSYQALATEAFEALEGAAPESAYMLRLVGDLRLEQKQYPSALFLYREALDRDPTIRGLHAAMAEIYRATGHDDWAAASSSAEAELGPPACEEPSLECAFLEGDLDEVVAARGADPEELFWRAKAASTLAGRAFDRLTALPSSPRKHELMASLLAEQDRFAEAADHWKKALDADPGNLDYQAGYATQLYLARETEKARPLVEKLLERAPDAPQWNFFLGDLKLQELDAEGAVPLLEKAVAADPSLLAARHALGRAYMAVEEPEKAIPHLEAALAIDTDGSLHYQLAQAYIQTGQRQKAREPLATSRQMQQSVQARQAAAQEMSITAPPRAQ